MAAGVNARFIDLKDSHISDIMTELVDAKYICVGSSTLNSNMLPTVAAFLTYMKGLSPKQRKAMAFGSYGWGGQSVAQVEEGLKDCGFELFMDKIRVQFIPSDKVLQEVAQLVTSAVGKE